MTTQDTHLTQTDVLGPGLSKSEALTIERDAKKHLDGFASNGFALAVDLRRLQDGGAHLLRGHTNFGEYIEAKFAGQISADYAKKLSLVGKVIIALIDADRVTLTAGGHKAAHKTLGTTGARALSAVQSKHGQAVMLAVYDLAAEIAKDKGMVITDEIVKAVLAPQLPEPKPEPVPEPEPESEPESDHELTDAEQELLQIVQNVDEDCMRLEDLITNRGAGGALVPEYAKSIAEEVAKLQAALEAIRAGS
jgi:hypothetical protein